MTNSHSPSSAASEGARYVPPSCPCCEYDRQFPGFEAGGWMEQDNNGPIVSCPLCNNDGTKAPRP